MMKNGLQQIPRSVDNKKARVFPVITAAAHFRSYAELADTKGRLHRKVELQFVQVNEVRVFLSGSLTLGTFWEDEPYRKMFVHGKNLVKDGTTYIDEDNKKMYGFKFINKSSHDLYPYLFFFDYSKFKIGEYFIPPSAGYGNTKHVPPLKARKGDKDGELIIHGGSTGEVPRSFRLPKGRDVYIGFFKLFLSTEYIDYSGIKQDSPFGDNPEHNDGKLNLKGVGKVSRPSDDDSDDDDDDDDDWDRGADIHHEKWDVIKVDLIQKRGHKMDEFVELEW